MKNFTIFALALATLCACGPTDKANKNKTEDVSGRTTSLSANENPDPAHNAENALDWMGTYDATLPCADCPGIKTTLFIHEDGTFTINSEYLDKDTRSSDSGTFTWDDSGSIIHLKGSETDIKLKVGENILFQLDQEGNEISGPLAANYQYTKRV